MKKIFTTLACAALFAGFSASAQHTIFISNETGWENPTLYAWGDAEIFGGWPGASSAGTETINGVVYDKYTVDATYNDLNENLIYNITSSQLKDFPVTLNRDYYFVAYSTGLDEVDPNSEITPPEIKYNKLYVENGTSWATVNVYAWADGQPELFGGWPGAASKGNETIEGANYLVFDMQAGTTGYNFIFNDGSDAGKIEGLYATPDADLFVKLNADNTYTVVADPRKVEYTLYIEDKTGWDALYVYAWGNNVPELFGAWPGAAAEADTETINGVTYKKYPFLSNGETYNLIFNNNAGTQYDALQIVADKNYYINATATAATENTTSIANIATANDSEAVYFNLQGVQVNNPGPGLYIVVKNGKATKVCKK